MRRYPPRAPSARGGSHGPRFGSLFPVRGFRPGLSPSAWGCSVWLRVGIPLLLRVASAPGSRWRRGGFLCGESPQRSGDVARIRCVPRVSVPKPCIRASAPHAPVFRGSRTQSICRGLPDAGFWRCAFAPGSGFVCRRSSSQRASAQAGCVFATGSPHERDGVVSMRVSKACFGDAVRTPSWRAVPVGFSAGFPCKRVAFRRGSPAHRFRPAFPAGFVRKQAA